MDFSAAGCADAIAAAAINMTVPVFHYSENTSVFTPHRAESPMLHALKLPTSPTI
jgi:hypothetical protein